MQKFCAWTAAARPTLGSDLRGATRAVLARKRATERRRSSSGTLAPALQRQNTKLWTSDQPTGRSTSRRAVDSAGVQNFMTENYHATRNVPDQTANTSPSAVAWNRLVWLRSKLAQHAALARFRAPLALPPGPTRPGTPACSGAALKDARNASFGLEGRKIIKTS